MLAPRQGESKARTSALASHYGDRITLTTVLIKPNILRLRERHTKSVSV